MFGITDNTPVTVDPAARCGLLAAVALAFIPQCAICRPMDDPPTAQPAAPPAPMTALTYQPATAADRVEWAIQGTIGLRSLLIVGPLGATVLTGMNSPQEWHQTWEGFGRRYAHREADVAISNAIEAGAGALWGEEPRYVPS